ncbi:MAG: hypothetical protein KQA41_01345 [Candidatus Aenigmarchaeota archaeon]|nr:hypothetical protein [Candidatus Aenigmarchaeota archaeon]
MFYAFIECNGREDCPFDCIYKNELPGNLLREVVGGGKVVIGDNGFYCQRGQSVGTVYFFEKSPDLPNLYIFRNY